MDLKELRFEIDKIDDELIRLFDKRMDLSVKVALYKLQKGLPVYDPVREQEILEKLSGKVSEGRRESVVAMYRLLFELSRAEQEVIFSDAGDCGSSPQ